MSCQLAATPEFPWTMAMFSDSHGPLWRFDAQRDAGKMPTLPCLQRQEPSLTISFLLQLTAVGDTISDNACAHP